LTNYGQINHWGRDDKMIEEEEDADFIDHCYVKDDNDTKFKVNLMSEPIEALDKFTPNDTL
jgi:hypothetical protein